MRQRPIELTIEELVLHGADPGDRVKLTAAIEAELTHLITEEGLPAAFADGGIVSRLNAGTVKLTGGASAETAGTQIAGAVYGGLRR